MSTLGEIFAAAFQVPAVVYYFPILVQRILLFDHQTSPLYSNMFQNEADAGPFKSPSTA